MATYTKETLPPWPILPDGFSPDAIIDRREHIFVGAIVFRSTGKRVYIKDADGRTGAPLYRYSFEAFRIEGETRVSWLVAPSSNWRLENCDKVPKRDLSTVFGRDDIEEHLFVEGNRYRLAGLVTSLRGNREDFVKLREIARVLGDDA